MSKGIREQDVDANDGLAHDPDYRTSLQDFTSFIEVLSEKLIEADDTIPELPVKDIVRPSPHQAALTDTS